MRLVQVINENIKAPHYWLCLRDVIVARWTPSQRASDACSISMFWRHHGPTFRYVVKTGRHPQEDTPLNGSRDPTKIFIRQLIRRKQATRPPIWCWTHYNDVIMGAIASQITSLTIVIQPFIQAKIDENIKAPRHWSLCGEFTGDRWIPRTNGQ